MVSSNSYETTSSEDTRCEDSPSDGDAESEMERRADDLEPTQAEAGSEGASSGTSSQERCEDDDLQELSAEAAPCAQHKADR